jgi:hypothetical protein
LVQRNGRQRCVSFNGSHGKKTRFTKTGSGQTYTKGTSEKRFCFLPCRPTAPPSVRSQQGCQQRQHRPARKRSVFDFSLCLSRACLGKKITFIYQWLKKTVFSPPCKKAAVFQSVFSCSVLFVPSLSWHQDRVSIEKDGAKNAFPHQCLRSREPGGPGVELVAGLPCTTNGLLSPNVSGACPEPVLANIRLAFQYIKWRRKHRFCFAPG